MESARRDRRAQTDVARLVGAVATITTAIILVPALVPGWVAELGALRGIGTLSAAALATGRRIAERYERHLRAVLGGGPIPGPLRAEVADSAGWERNVHSSSRRSPHAWRRTGTPAEPSLLARA